MEKSGVDIDDEVEKDVCKYVVRESQDKNIS